MDSSLFLSFETCNSNKETQDSAKIRLCDSNYFHQKWSLPDSVIHYIAKKPSSPNLYQKLVKLCKYFFVKNSILILTNLHYTTIENAGWNTWDDKGQINIDLKNIASLKFWITEEIDIFSRNISDKRIATFIIPKIYQCNVEVLNLGFQEIQFKDLTFFAPTVECLTFHYVKVVNDDGIVLVAEKTFACFPKLQSFQCTDNLNIPSITENTVKELIKLQRFQTLETFYLNNVPEVFDIEYFYIYMKKNKVTDFSLNFWNTIISEAYKARLETIVDEIIDSNEHDFNVPYITFNGIVDEKCEKLLQLSLKGYD